MLLRQITVTDCHLNGIPIKRSWYDGNHWITIHQHDSLIQSMTRYLCTWLLILWFFLFEIDRNDPFARICFTSFDAIIAPVPISNLKGFGYVVDTISHGKDNTSTNIMPTKTMCFISWDILHNLIYTGKSDEKNTYHKTSSIRRTKFQNLNVSHLVLQLSLPNPLKQGVKKIMKM